MEKNIKKIVPHKLLYQIGGRVKHKTFGYGTIVSRDGLGIKTKLTVSFAKNVRKTFIAKLANLEKMRI